MKVTIDKYLAQYKEEMPDWLKSFHDGDKVPFAEVMSGRIGYYPGCGSDGQLIKLGNLSHSLHAYLYVDYTMEREEVMDNLSGPHSIRGYHVIGTIEYNKEDILPHGSYAFSTIRSPQMDPGTFRSDWYCVMCIWERDNDRSRAWGAQRLATIFLCDDAIETYYQLFVKQYCKVPWILLLQDHGLGLNYDRFGRGGLLDEIIIRNNAYPPLVLLAEHTSIWQGYRPADCIPDRGGMHNVFRYLYIHDSTLPIVPVLEVQEFKDFLLNDLINHVSTLSPEERKALRCSDIIKKYCIGYNRATRLMEQLYNEIDIDN